MVTIYIPANLRRQVYQRARGCCEYCLLPELAGFSVHQFDHIIAQKHGGATNAKNLALACPFCNRRKGSDLSAIDLVTGKLVRLFHPRQHTWFTHFRFIDAQIVPLTAIGRATANLLQFNLPVRVEERALLITLGLLKLL
jgi:hypothetical protein